MGFGNFKTDSEVAKKFNLVIEDGFFLKGLPFTIPEYELKKIKNHLGDRVSFVSEEAICEDIIKPILNIFDDAYEEFRVWSHITYNVKPEENLSGRPDFLIARPTKIVDIMDVPPLCVIEAKKEDWDEGWAQALAEMYAASIQGATVCYAVVTSGEEWQFGKFDKKEAIFTKDKRKLHATDYPDEPNNLQRVFDSLNWMFDEASRVEIKKE